MISLKVPPHVIDEDRNVGGDVLLVVETDKVVTPSLCLIQPGLLADGCVRLQEEGSVVDDGKTL